MQSSTMHGHTVHECYNPRYQACFNDTLCSRSEVCGEQCLQQGQWCTSNKTICNSPSARWYFSYPSGLTAYDSCSGICYDPRVEQCIDGTIQCINNNNCSGTCYDSSMRKCLNGTLCYMSQDLCYVKNSELGHLNTFPSNQCYDPSYQTCFNNTLCHSYQVCSGQCLQRGQRCINNQTICSSRDTMLSYNYWPKSTVYDSCNGICYDLTLEQCIDGNIQCINNNNCSGTCYNSSTHKCFNRTLCQVDEDFCNVKSGGSDVENYPHLVCYNPNYQLCLNNTLCRPFQVCDQQCLEGNQLCINNKTICQIRSERFFYNYRSRVNLNQSCNGTCYDSNVYECIDDIIQCIGNDNCSGACYNSSTHTCWNGTLCLSDAEVCYVKYDERGRLYNPPIYQCYDPNYQVCLNDALCLQTRLCDQQCLRENQLCVKDKTICNLRNQNWYHNQESWLNVSESCNGICYDPRLEQCIDARIQCINNNNCSGVCYDSSTYKCINGTLCGVDADLCYVKYGAWYNFLQPVCYNPNYQLCLNNTLCRPFQVCDQQCLEDNQLCINNKTICQIRSERFFYNYRSRVNLNQSCNGTCYDSNVYECIDDIIQCIGNDNCSGACYNSSTHTCWNGTLCLSDAEVCYVKYDERGRLYNPPIYQCYDPNYQVCLNDALCLQTRLCDQQCLRENQLCVKDKTICNLRNQNWYHNQESWLNVSESCNGICYDPRLEQCIDARIQCINNNNCSGVCYDSSTYKCINGTLCGVDADLCYVKYGAWYNFLQPVCYNPNYQLCRNNTLCTQSQVCGELCLGENELCMTNKSVCIYSNKEWHYNNTSQSTTIKSCSGICYDPLTHNCLNGTLCGLDEVLCFVQNSSWSMQFDSQLRCYNPKVQVCLDNTPCYQFEVCGQRCLRTDQLCINRNTTCNSSLFYRHTEASQIEACNGMCYNTPVQLCIDGKVVNKSNVSPIVLKTTTVAFVSSDYQSLWWDIFKINCYIMVVVAVAFFITRRLAVWPWTKIEKSIYLDPEQISLIKSDQI
ncbi:unnamed protein product [Adineta ricciae]|uniref:Uncharacterized protein n=1 Tax=Adineta ricciae TaxID=249248 RepID=A0A815JIB5_ADIRI|nr:unnamed protein product [Adineta ricciae]